MKQVSITSNRFFSQLPKSNHKFGVFYTYRFILLFGVLAMTAGCQKSPERQIVPLHAEFTTVTTMLQQGPPELDLIKGVGSGTPIGKSSFDANAKFDQNYNLTGTITLTAKNSDTFFAAITGQAPDINEKTGAILLHFHADITGGTGIFKKATGSFEGVAHESLNTPDGTVAWDGNIIFN